MNEIEKIRQEIERLKKLLEESTYYLDNSQQALGYSFALDDFNEFLDTLSEEPDKSLEEAAEKFAHFYDQGTCDGIAQDCFIAGAKWQMEQKPDWSEEGGIVNDLNEGKIKAVQLTDGTYITEKLAEKLTKSMTKAQAAAFRAFPGKPFIHDRCVFRMGYEQAEKDLAPLIEAARYIVELGKVLNARKEDEK